MRTKKTENGANPSQPGSMPPAISACFFLSGLAGLVYEVIWARQLGLFLGITAYAHTAVITAYMAGLAAGSYYFGRRSDRQANPLKTYAWLEIGVGVYAAITPWLIPALQAVYAGSADPASLGHMSGHLSRLAIAMLALLVPTFLMGGTLPVLVRGFTAALPELGKMTGRLYGINTLGAVTGTLLAGFLLLPGIGVTASLFVGVVINIGIAIYVLAFLKEPKLEAVAIEPPSASKRHADPVTEPGRSKSARRVILFAFAGAGFAALLAQLAWIRALTLVIGGSVYAFSITLAGFLAGIGLGSLLYERHLSNPTRWLSTWIPRQRPGQAAWLSMLICLTLLLGLPVIGKLPAWFLAGYASGLADPFALFQAYIFILGFGLMFAPTLFMGAMFPLVVAMWTRSLSQAGRGVGTAYAINTAGTILGTLLGGLVILPSIGVHGGIQLAAGIYCLVALGFWGISRPETGRVGKPATIGVAVLMAGLIAWVVPPWNRDIMVSGVFSRPGSMIMAVAEQAENDLGQVVGEYELLYYGEGPDATVAVRRKKNSPDAQRTLVINGKADASSAGDMPTQILLAQLPLALNRQINDALVIGLGSGITAGSLAASKSLRSLTILEISDEVIEASKLFAPENRDVLTDPRVNLVTADARNYLMASQERFDLIVSEPSNPWISGIANLFTDEFLKLAKSRLSDNGVMTQWFHVYSMSEADLKAMLKTFDRNFSYVSVWQIQAGDIALIGSDRPHALSLANAASTGAAELSRANVRNARDLVGLYVTGGDFLSGYARDARINSDLTPVIEFNAPKYLYAASRYDNMENIFDYLQGRQQVIPMADNVEVSGDHLIAPFMSLRVATTTAPPGRVNANWLIDRPKVELSGVATHGIGSERILEWTEGKARYQVRAVWQQSAKPGESLQNLLARLSASTGRESGKASLADGSDAIWLLDAGRGRPAVHIDAAWDCPASNSAFNRYALSAVLPVTGGNFESNLVVDLLGRFECFSYSSFTND